MGVLRMSFFVVFTCWVLSLPVEAKCDCPGYSLKMLQVPSPMSRWNSATFAYESFSVLNGEPCTDCCFTCKLDNGSFSACEDKKVTYGGLLDGKHSFKVCSNGSLGIGCDCYNWTIDTFPPTASLTTSTSFTNALNFSVKISFTEPCLGGGGFRCSSVDDCNLLVDGAGQVIPSSLRILQPNLTYSLLVNLNSSSQYGNVTLLMDKDFCNDSAGNRFMQNTRSTLIVHYDRRSVSADLTTQIPMQTVRFDGKYRTLQATNDKDSMKIYFNFPQPILNSSTDILNSLHINVGRLVPIPGETQGNRRYGFIVNETSPAVVIITFNNTVIRTREGTVVSPIKPITILYDDERPAVKVTSPPRTREQNIPFSIEFTKPVFSFNKSHIKTSGGQLQSFEENNQRKYSVEIKAESEFVSVIVPENVTADVAGNKNVASESLQVWHYNPPTLSRVVSTTATASYVATAFAAGLLSISTASLQSLGAFENPSSSLTSEPSRNLFRMAGHIQVFALLRWLAVELPVEYYELARGLQWIIPHFSLPWEAGHIQPIMGGLNPPSRSKTFFTRTIGSETYATIQRNQDNLKKDEWPGLPLLPEDLLSYFKDGDDKPEVDPQNNGWRDFGRNMFWLAVIGGGLILMHTLLLLILKYKKKSNDKQRNYGALSFPRFEIFLLILVLPCICQASAYVIRGGTPLGIVVGTLLLGLVAFGLLALLLFLFGGITLGKLLHYKEVCQEGQNYQWYQELVRVILGPGKKGEWTWKNQQNSIQLILFGPLFEDIRSPSKYMLSQNSGSNPSKGEQTTAPNNGTGDTEAPFVQKLFGILGIYYTLLEIIRRVSLGIFAGACSKSSRTPSITLLCITCFQLFFLVLTKPFIMRRVQLVEIISLSTEAAQLATCAVLLSRKSSGQKEIGIGIFMVILFLAGFVAQMVNELCALYSQIKQLDEKDKSFFAGLKVASLGLVSILLKV